MSGGGEELYTRRRDGLRSVCCVMYPLFCNLAPLGGWVAISVEWCGGFGRLALTYFALLWV